jgi:hypothetical protein
MDLIIQVGLHDTVQAQMMVFWIFTFRSGMLKHPPKPKFATLILKATGLCETSKETKSTGRKVTQKKNSCE